MAVDDEFEDDTASRLSIAIEVTVREGSVTEVRYQGKEARAIVHDYDVEFPCVANAVRTDEDGELYMEQIV